MTSLDVAQAETVGLDLGKRWFHVHGVDGHAESGNGTRQRNVVPGHRPGA